MALTLDPAFFFGIQSPSSRYRDVALQFPEQINITNLVVQAYQRAVGNTFIKPKIYPKTLENSEAFFALEGKTGRSLAELMALAVKQYSKDWLEKNLHMKVVPFNMVISPANRKRLLNNLRPKQETTPEQFQKQAEDIAQTMRSTMGESALAMTEHWPPDPKLRKLVRALLKKK